MTDQALLRDLFRRLVPRFYHTSVDTSCALLLRSAGLQLVGHWCFYFRFF